jgi:hypothetical protein
MVLLSLTFQVPFIHATNYTNCVNLVTFRIITAQNSTTWAAAGKLRRGLSVHCIGMALLSFAYDAYN